MLPNLPNTNCCNTNNRNHLCAKCTNEYDRMNPKPKPNPSYFGANNVEPLPLPTMFPDMIDGHPPLVSNDNCLPLPNTIEVLINERRARSSSDAKATASKSSNTFDGNLLPLPTMTYGD